MIAVCENNPSILADPAAHSSGPPSLKVHSKRIIDFKDHYSLCFNSSRKTNTYMSGITQAIKVCAECVGHNAEQWTNEQELDWAKDGFPEPVAPVLEGNIFMH